MSEIEFPKPPPYSGKYWAVYLICGWLDERICSHVVAVGNDGQIAVQQILTYIQLELISKEFADKFSWIINDEIKYTIEHLKKTGTMDGHESITGMYRTPFFVVSRASASLADDMDDLLIEAVKSSTAFGPGVRVI
jgi:aldehyde:ferredoxin oxidoreductase